jgi:Mn2+/Fe2+ NRAMP family transporter
MRERDLFHFLRGLLPVASCPSRKIIAEEEPMMPDTFRSKIDPWLPMVLAGALAIVVLAVVATVGTDPTTLTILAAILVLDAGLMVWILAGTRYVLDRDVLRVRCGPFRWEVPIAEISAVTPTRTPQSSPALSLDRLHIEYGEGRALIISPADKDGFIRALDRHRIAR